ncbi:MAG: bifunctional serine/threonine-protein kinase/formylglycine-generating enzyme family protein [Rhodospirillales bacterium]
MVSDDQGSVAVPTSVEAGDVIRDRFVLEAEIGAGGMGRVFKALDLRRLEARDRNPHVAVKLLTHAFREHPASFVALQREARRAQTLAHPNIISVFDFDREGSLVYLIMEYLHGRTLNDIMAQPDFAGIGWDGAMGILRPIGEALAFAHRHGIVHSDLKPSNIFLTEDGRVKVIDFGIARAFRLPDAADGDATLFDASSLRAFSPLYASPELIDGDPADPRDDVFSLACITYELISGKHPFGRRSAAVARRANQEPERLPNLSRGQWMTIRRGLCFARDERTANIDAFLLGLDPKRVRPGRGRPGVAKAAHQVRDYLVRLDPRPPAKAFWLQATALLVRARGLLARLDLRPAARALWRHIVASLARTGALLARLDARPAVKRLMGEFWRHTVAAVAFIRRQLNALATSATRPNLRRPAVMAATAMALIGGFVWLYPYLPVLAPQEEPAPSAPQQEPEKAEKAAPAHDPFVGLASLPGVNEAAIPAAQAPAAEAVPDLGAAAAAGADQPLPVAENHEPPLAAGMRSITTFRDCAGCPEMVVIPSGSFMMGAPPTDKDAEREEWPQRRVTIDHRFAIGRFEVTEAQWSACAGTGFCGRDKRKKSPPPSEVLPKAQVNFDDAQAFVLWLNSVTEGGYRLPTEAEWEYAARGGTTSRYPWGDDVGENHANCRACGSASGNRAAPVGSFAANGFGVFDMIGNLWEWTADCGLRRSAPEGADAPCLSRVLRGGSWANSAQAVRVSQRLTSTATIRDTVVGFRVAKDLP